MWSDLYWYFNIRSNKSLSRSLPTSDIVAVLKKQRELKQIGPQSFTNCEGFPGITIDCADSKDGGYAHNNKDSTPKSNLIAVVASMKNNRDYDRYILPLTEIANQLAWELILEEDDDSNEDIVINK